MITEKDLRGNRDVLLKKVINEFKTLLKTDNETLGNLMDGLETHMASIADAGNFRKAFRQSVQPPMSYIIYQVIEDNGLDGTEILGKLYDGQAPDCLIWGLFDIKKAEQAVDEVIEFIVQTRSKEVLNKILEIELY